MSARDSSAWERLTAWQPHGAVVFGSGLATVPLGGTVEDELTYASLGWPRTTVSGHRNRLQLVRVRRANGCDLRLALACGRAHGYEGFREEALEDPVRSLVRARVRRLVLTCSSGSLRPGIAPGNVVVCAQVVDLQRPPRGAEPPRLRVCSGRRCTELVAAIGRSAATVGTYVAVAGPQFETPAEVAWLSAHGDVVGMSAAAEVRAARDAGGELCLLALVANRSGAEASHDDVLAAGSGLAVLLAARLEAVLAARWPDVRRAG